MSLPVFTATDFLFASTSDNKRHGLYRLDILPKRDDYKNQAEYDSALQAALVCAVDYGAADKWEIEQFWPSLDPDYKFKPTDLMDQNVLTQGQGGVLVDGIWQNADVVLVAAENQYRLGKKGLYRDVSCEYSNAAFALAQISPGHHVIESVGGISWNKYSEAGKVIAGPAAGMFWYRVSYDLTIGVDGQVTTTVLEEWWQAMQETDPDHFNRKQRPASAAYRRLQRYDKGAGLGFVHDLDANLVYGRTK